MSIIEANLSGHTYLDGSGNGKIFVSPAVGTKFAARLATATVSSATKTPTFQLFRGSSTTPLQLVDSTQPTVGGQASSGKVAGAVYYSGQGIWLVCTGGDTGAQLTLEVFGQQGGRNDPLSPTSLSEGFPVMTTSLVLPTGATSGPRIVIGVDIPAELVAYYSPSVVTGAILYYNNTGYSYTAVLNTNYTAYGAVISGIVMDIFQLVNGTTEGVIYFGALNPVSVQMVNTGCDFTIATRSISRGMVGVPVSTTVNSAAISTPEASDNALAFYTADLIHGRRYRPAYLDAFAASGATGDRYLINVRMAATAPGNTDTLVSQTMWSAQSSNIPSAIPALPSFIFTGTTGTYQFAVFALRVNGVNTMNFSSPGNGVWGGTASRQFYLIDEGSI